MISVIFWQSLEDVHVLLDRCNIPVIFSTIIIFCVLRSLLQRKGYITQEMYPELIAIRFFFKMQKMTDADLIIKKKY